MLKIFLLIFACGWWPGCRHAPQILTSLTKTARGRGVGGGASNLYNIISIHSEKNVGWILHEDNGPNHPMIHLNVKCGYIL